jgi:hypothetical protein
LNLNLVLENQQAQYGKEIFRFSLAPPFIAESPPQDFAFSLLLNILLSFSFLQTLYSFTVSFLGSFIRGVPEAGDSAAKGKKDEG